MIALLLVLLVLSMFDDPLAWTWGGVAGSVVLALGLIELLAPAWFNDFRRRFVAYAPRWQRARGGHLRLRVWYQARTGTLRILGGLTVLVSAAILALARYVSSLA